MAITIDDIYDKEFKIAGDGYDKEDVDQFLDEVCDEMIDMQNNMVQLENNIKRLENELATKKNVVQPTYVEPNTDIEEMVRPDARAIERMLLTAERICSETENDANNQARTIIEDAKNQASQIIGNVHTEKATLESEIATLRQTRDNFQRELRTMLENYVAMVNNENEVQ